MFGAMMLLLALQAVEPNAPPTNDVVVTARRPDTVETARHYVSQVSRTSVGQLARFRDPICPAVSGLAPDHAEMVVRRIRWVAARVGVPVAAAGCPVNITLIFTQDGGEFVREAHRVDLKLFLGLELRELRRLMRGREAVRAWNTVSVRNEDGLDMPCGAGGGGQAGAASGLCVRRSSIISLPTTQVILQSFIVVENEAAAGKSLGQLADYAAMRTLADTRSPRGVPAAGETILTLFEPGGGPPGISGLDLAYLAALYRAPANERSTQQIARMATLIAAAAAREAGSSAETAE